MAPECSYPVSGTRSCFVWAGEVPDEDVPPVPRAEDGNDWLRGQTAADFHGVAPPIYHYTEIPELVSEFRTALDPALREDEEAP